MRDADDDWKGDDVRNEKLQMKIENLGKTFVFHQTI
jgi:hypothetical protein